MKNENENIPQELFEFAQLDAVIHDKKIETKARGFFADALLRFKKNKSSVVAAYIILFLIIFSILSPLLSPYTIKDKDVIYSNYPPYYEKAAKNEWGFLDGSTSLASQNDLAMARLRGIAQETGMDPVIRIVGTTEKEEKERGKIVKKNYYQLEVNKYYMVGINTMTISYEEFQNIMKFQDETGIQVLFPWVEPKDIKDITDTAVWYEVKDKKGTPKLDKEGNFIPAYSTRTEIQGEIPYTSKRIAGDPGTYIYSYGVSGAVKVRLCYYNYYIYMNGHAPSYLFGTNVMGQDLFMAIGVGARFSLIFALLVSAINLTIGTIYGAIQGYYGGSVDMLMDRVADILSGVPFIVVVTLFQKHLAQKVGIVPTFLFAFVLTGWIGMSALVRKQFYRFKGQEYVMAARTLGASDKRLMFKHIFPNSLGTIITSCALVIPGVISSETMMTYLGIVDLSSFAGTTIGTLMSQGQAVATSAPHAMVFPSIFVSLLLISFNLFGNGLRDAFNPSTRGVED